MTTTILVASTTSTSITSVVLETATPIIKVSSSPPIVVVIVVVVVYVVAAVVVVVSVVVDFRSYPVRLSQCPLQARAKDRGCISRDVFLVLEVTSIVCPQTTLFCRKYVFIGFNVSLYRLVAFDY